jgi:LPXTG-motif cell wall-anchored protein
MVRIVGVTMLLIGVSSFAFAGAVAPEIDPSTGVGAIALLGGGLIVLRARRKKA